MPIREVICKKGHVEEVLLIRKTDFVPARCSAVENGQACGELVQLVEVSVTARSFPGADGWRK